LPPVAVVVLKLPVDDVNVTLLFVGVVGEVIVNVVTTLAVPVTLNFAEVAPAVCTPAKVMPVTGIRNAAPIVTARKSLLFNVFLLLSGLDRKWPNPLILRLYN
jgi:hypothetical protein